MEDLIVLTTKQCIKHIVIILFLCVPGPLLAAAEGNVLYDGDSVSLSFHNMPLSVALGKIAAQTDIEFLLDDGLSGNVSARIKNLPIDEAVRRLLGKYNHAMFFQLKQGGGYDLSKVKVFRQGKQALAKYMPITGRNALINHSAGSGGTSSGDGHGAISKTATDPSDSFGTVMSKPFLKTGPGMIMREIQQNQQTASILQHKARIEEGILKSKISETRQAMSEGAIESKDGLGKIKELEGQLVRKNQSNAMMILNNQKNLQELHVNLDLAKTPLDQKQEAIDRINRQRVASGQTTGNAPLVTKARTRQKRRSSNYR